MTDTQGTASLLDELIDRVAQDARADDVDSSDVLMLIGALRALHRPRPAAPGTVAVVVEIPSDVVDHVNISLSWIDDHPLTISTGDGEADQHIAVVCEFVRSLLYGSPT